MFFKKKESPLQWNKLTDTTQLVEVDKLSEQKPVLIFKHSTRCPISAMALDRFERGYEKESPFEPYFVDLIADRAVSNAIASQYDVVHESPQAILIKNGKASYHTSHNAIDYADLVAHSG